MTELIVALDGPEPFKLMIDLHAAAAVRSFKVGPLTLLSPGAMLSIEAVLAKHRKEMALSVFYDAKLADHGPYVCEELAKRLGEKGYAALSTSTDEATEAAVRGAEGSPLRVWRHVAPTSQNYSTYQVVPGVRSAIDQGAHGVICSAVHVSSIREFTATIRSDWPEIDVVCPGVRFAEEGGDALSDGHFQVFTPEYCIKRGVTHAVVGRPIWRSSDPVAAARRYQEALRG